MWIASGHRLYTEKAEYCGAAVLAASQDGHR